MPNRSDAPRVDTFHFGRSNYKGMRELKECCCETGYACTKGK